MPAKYVRKITYPEFRRRVFNQALLECFCKIHGQVLNGGCCDDCATDQRMADMAARLCTNFCKEELSLDNSTVDQTKAKLSEAVQFIRDCVETCENIADDKCDAAQKDKVQIEDDQKIELSQEDKAVIDQLFDSKNPTPQIDTIRDATVAALVAEEKKAAEIKQAIDIAQSKVAAGEDPATLEETVKRLNAVGPTSLMNAIMNNISAQAVKDISESGNFVSVGKAMADNADEIKSRAVAVYSLYEMASVFGMKKYTSEDVKRLALSIYYEK